VSSHARWAIHWGSIVGITRRFEWDLLLRAAPCATLEENKMADTQPTTLKFLKIIYLCCLAIFNPKKFIEEEKKDNAIRENFSPAEDKEDRIYVVRRAFWRSLGLIIASALFGGLVGLFLRYYCNQPPSFMIIILQVVGACLLLWGTLFIRGWEIQTYCGVTLTERVNQWIYRILYCLGTSIIICSLIWALK